MSLTFEITILLSLGLSAIFWLLGRKGDHLSTGSHVCDRTFLDLATLVGAFPYALIVENCDLSDALFECIETHDHWSHGFWNFYEFPASLLFWRSLSQ